MSLSLAQALDLLATDAFYETREGLVELARLAPAHYSLGMVCLTLGDKPKTIEVLSANQRAQPADGTAGDLIQAIRDGKVEDKQVGEK